MTTLSLPVYNPAALAAALRERGLPGQRSKTAITRLRRQRAQRRVIPDLRPPDPLARTTARMTALYQAEIERRGGETGIDGQDQTTPLRITDRNQGLTLLHAHGWRWYGRNAKVRLASLSYLCGREDGQVWAVRVPGTIETVRGALAWLTPAAVTKARNAGRRVERQGDVYAIETTGAHDGAGALPDRHAWDPARRVLSHPQHQDLHLPHPVRFARQNAYGMGRGAGRACGD